ncbi:helix-turn-helix domain-containing protein [Streptacidiphilus cavernicola]|uniref:Helix-turn-helix domain-containing protein n=1 Tax=Streptacidiphilus cavernicola TaxID=3342716 RepID=A0ABV6VZY0_9ACTN
METALAEFTDLVDGSAPSRDERLRVYRALGRGEAAEGRSLDALQAAFRTGARVAWRRYARVARRVGLGPDLLVVVAEAIFTHIDEMASASVRGYNEAKTDEPGAFVRRRRALLDLIVTAAPGPAVAQAAADADWPLPAWVACVALSPAGSGAGNGAGGTRTGTGTGGNGAGTGRAVGNGAGIGGVGLGTGTGSGLSPNLELGLGPGANPTGTGLRSLPGGILSEPDGPAPFLLLPDPARLLTDPHLRTTLADRGAVVGPTVPLELAADSLRWARAAHATTQRTNPGTSAGPDRPGPGPNPGTATVARPAPRTVDDRLAELLLLGDPPLVRLMAARRLSPLSPLTPKQSERLGATLLAWLQTNRGTAPEVATRLGIHPQTARQRLHRVQQLFGPALSDPDARFELEVALRGRLLAAEPGRNSHEGVDE